MNKTVKTIIIAVVILALIVLMFFVGGSTKETSNTSSGELSNDPEVILSNAERESAAVTEAEKKEFPQIDVNTYLAYYADSEARVILLARPTCHYCQIAEPIIQKMAKDYDLTIYYLNTDNFVGDDQSNFVNSNEVFANGYGTPYLFVVKDNAIVDAVDGLTDAAHYEAFFAMNGFIE